MSEVWTIESNGKAVRAVVKEYSVSGHGDKRFRKVRDIPLSKMPIRTGLTIRVSFETINPSNPLNGR